MSIAQIFIFITGVPAIYLVSRKDKWKKWGYIFGLLSQPFWFYATITNKQWGITALCLFYTYSWCNGIYNYWIKKDEFEVSFDLDDDSGKIYTVLDSWRKLHDDEKRQIIPDNSEDKG